MNKKSSFYIDADKAAKWGIIGSVSVYLNGKKIDKCTAAKSGVNGYVEFYDNIESKRVKGYIRIHDSVPTIKKRGNVQIKIKPA